MNINLKLLRPPNTDNMGKLFVTLITFAAVPRQTPIGGQSRVTQILLTN